MNKLETDKIEINIEDDNLRHADGSCVNESKKEETLVGKLKYVFLGLFLGMLFVKAEIISWFRIQEMFRFQSFHMYGIIGSAVIVAATSVYLLKKFKVKTIQGEDIVIAPKKFNKGQIIGGLLFGIGWAITGACPGPLFAQVGAGFGVAIVTLLSAILGTFVYGLLRDKLPH